MKNLIRLIVAYSLLVMVWASYSLVFVSLSVGAPMLILGIASILFMSATYLLKITK